MSERKNTAALQTDGWLRLWEAIYEHPWPLRDQQAMQAFAAWYDWRHDQAELFELAGRGGRLGGMRERFTA